MSEPVTTIVAALIGAGLGSVGAVFLAHYLTQRSEKKHRQDVLIQRYLFQLQDALEMLYYRLRNLVYQGGGHFMSKEYFEKSTLYALGRVLAMERIFALDAVYPQLDAFYPGFGQFLKQHRTDLQLQHTEFYVYDRLSLAEAIIEREGDWFRTITYLEFLKRYETEEFKEWLKPAIQTIRSLPPDRMKALLATLQTTANRIADKTGIDISLTE